MKIDHCASALRGISHGRRLRWLSLRPAIGLAPCLIALCTVTTLCTVTVAPAEAAIVNGGFESGAFAPWTLSGGAGVASGAFGTGPHSGSFQALMENGPSAQSSIVTLETFLSVPSGALNGTVTPSPPGFSLFEGSAIRQTGVSVSAGDSITFAYNFLTDETSAVSDTAFYTLSSGALTGAFFLADPATPNAISFTTRFARETGYFAVNTGPLPAGTYIIGFGVADYGVGTVDSGLLVDSVVLVPEPGTFALAAFGLLALAACCWRRKAWPLAIAGDCAASGTRGGSACRIYEPERVATTQRPLRFSSS